MRIPNKMQEILDKHEFYLIPATDAVIINYVSSVGIKHHEKLPLKDNTIDCFIRTLDSYYESIDLTEIIDDIWDGVLSYKICAENKCLILTNSMIQNSFEEYERHLMVLRNDLYENCPRVDEHQNYLPILWLTESLFNNIFELLA